MLESLMKKLGVTGNYLAGAGKVHLLNTGNLMVEAGDLTLSEILLRSQELRIGTAIQFNAKATRHYVMVKSGAEVPDDDLLTQMVVTEIKVAVYEECAVLRAAFSSTKELNEILEALLNISDITNVEVGNTAVTFELPRG